MGFFSPSFNLQRPRSPPPARALPGRYCQSARRRFPRSFLTRSRGCGPKSRAGYVSWLLGIDMTASFRDTTTTPSLSKYVPSPPTNRHARRVQGRLGTSTTATCPRPAHRPSRRDDVATPPQKHHIVSRAPPRQRHPRSERGTISSKRYCKPLLHGKPYCMSLYFPQSLACLKH